MNTSPLIFNAYFLAHPFSGQGVYTAEVLKELTLKHKGQIILLALDAKSAESAKTWTHTNPSLTVLSLRLPSFIPLQLRLLAAELFWIPFILRRYPQYTYFSPYTHPMLGISKNHRHFMTLHDVIFFTVKEYQQKWTRKVYNALTRIILKNPSIHSLTVSKTSADEIQEILHPAHTPLVAYNGIDHLQKEELISKDDLTSKFGITGTYIFYHGGYDKRKNLSYVFEIYTRLKKTHPDLQLVLGGKALYQSSLYTHELHMPGVIQTGFISNSELRSLYHYASLFISPSTYEGFNIPIGEALMEDTPVLASDIPVHRELWSEYVTLMPLDDLDKAVSLAEEVLKQPKKPFSSHLFLWKNCSKKILEYFG